MFKNYFKIAFRNLLKHKGHSLINVAGLALGMASCLLIMLWVMEELNFDRFHQNAQYLYRVEQDQFYSGETYHVTVTPYPMGEGIKEEIPEIIDATRYVYTGNILIKYENKVFFENGIRAVDPSFLQIFTFPLIQGDPAKALNDHHGIIISEEMAEKYFGSVDPIDKTLTANNEYSFTVTGVMANVPTNSYLQFDMLIPFEFIKEIGRYDDSWGSNSITTLVQLHENASIPEVNRKITEIRNRHVLESIEDEERKQQFITQKKTEFMVMPFPDIHLHQYFGYGHPPGAIMYVYIFSIIALFILLIACINFMNLATARSVSRAKEVGLRKVVGAMKTNLIRQFYGESILMACLSLIVAFLLTTLLLPYFNTLAEKEFSLNDLLQARFLLGMVAITIITGFISGSYPALFLSSFHPVQVLKGTMIRGVKGALFRRILVVTQFTLSILLIIGTMIMYKQMTFIQNKKLGYDKEHIIYLPLRGKTRNSYQVLKENLKSEPDILNVSASMSWPASFGSNTGGNDWEGKDPDQTVLVSINSVDFDYVETMKIEMIEGRSFSKSFATDTSSAILINQELKRIMNKESAVNEQLSIWGIDGTIVGVMKDFHFQSMRNQIEPLALLVNTKWINFALVRLSPGNLQKAIQTVEKVWNHTIPQYPFEYHFLDEAVESMYETEKTIGTLLQIFTILAVLIACLGLFGLASFTAERRTKEIGVRKTLGASISSIVFLLSKEFTKWILIANGVAWPIAYLLMKNWLQNYAYRTSLSWWIFALSGVLALIIAILTVIYQALKAALMNPVDSLKYE